MGGGKQTREEEVRRHNRGRSDWDLHDGQHVNATEKTTPTKHRKTQGPAGTAGQSAHRGHNSTKGREPDETGTHWRGRPAPGRDQRALVVRKRPQSPSCRIQVVMPKSPARKERCEAKWQPSRQRAPRPSPGGAGDALHLGDKRPTFNFFFPCP